MKAINKKRVRRRLVYAAVILFLIGVISVSAFKVLNLVMENEEAQARLESLEEEKAKLEEELARVGSDEYIEQQAREQLNMIMPGETLYVLKDKKTDGDKEEDQAGDEESDD